MRETILFWNQQVESWHFASDFRLLWSSRTTVTINTTIQQHSLLYHIGSQGKHPHRLHSQQLVIMGNRMSLEENLIELRMVSKQMVSSRKERSYYFISAVTPMALEATESCKYCWPNKTSRWHMDEWPQPHHWIRFVNRFDPRKSARKMKKLH